MARSKRKKNNLPLTTFQGTMLVLSIGVFVALIFVLVYHIYARPLWLEPH
jgi:hypothetical protein